MTFSMFSVILPTIAYATVALSAIYSPAMLFQAQSGGFPVNRHYIQATIPTSTPSPTPTVIPTPTAVPVATVQSVATQADAAPVASDANAAPATTVLSDVQIQFLGNCESGMRPDTNTGNGYYGAFQFSYGTWQAMGTGYERADLAPLDVQIAAVQKLLSRSSIWTQFPGCAAKMSAAGLI